MAIGHGVHLRNGLREAGYEIDVLVVGPSAGAAHSLQFIGSCALYRGFVDIFVVEQVSHIDNHLSEGILGEGVAMKTHMRGGSQFHLDAFIIKFYCVVAGCGLLISV